MFISILFTSFLVNGIPLTVQEPKIEANFEWFDWGLGILIWNAGGEPVYNLSIDYIYSYGFMFVGATIGNSQAELEGASMRRFITPILGLGKPVVTVGISYEYEGSTYTKTIFGWFFVMGGLTLLLYEWEN